METATRLWEMSEKIESLSDEIERLREALNLILNANSLPYAHEIASKALGEDE
jgi:hypothetical protein